MGNRRGGNDGITGRFVDLEDRLRKLEQGIGFSSLTLRRLRLTDRTGAGKVEVVANDVGLEFRDLVAGSGPLTMPVPEGFGGTGSTYTNVPFGLGGGVIVSTSPPWLALRAHTINQIAVSLGTAGTTDTIVTVNLNGSPLVAITVPAGSSTAILGSGTAIGVGDRVTVSVTAAGVGAADLTVQIELL